MRRTPTVRVRRHARTPTAQIVAVIGMKYAHDTTVEPCGVRGVASMYAEVATAAPISTARNDHGIGRWFGKPHRNSTQMVASTVVPTEHGVMHHASTIEPPVMTNTPRHATIATSRIAIAKNSWLSRRPGAARSTIDE